MASNEEQYYHSSTNVFWLIFYIKLLNYIIGIMPKQAQNTLTGRPLSHHVQNW